MFQNLECQDRRYATQKETLRREARYLKRKLEQLQISCNAAVMVGTVANMKRRSVSECSALSSSSVSSSSISASSGSPYLSNSSINNSSLSSNSESGKWLLYYFLLRRGLIKKLIFSLCKFFQNFSLFFII